MKILVNGCSFSRGPGSWPYFLEKALNGDLCNLAQSGAGNVYIRQSTIAEVSKRNYDLVLIMWSGLERFDVQVEDIDFFETPYTSKYQSSQNDWPGKIVWPFNDQDHVEKNWVFGVGYINRDPFLTKNELFSGFYKHVGQQEHIRRSMNDMICLQDFLRARNINYAFSFYRDYISLLQSQQDLWSMIDHSKLIPGNLDALASELGSFDLDGIHPGVKAHSAWSEHVLGYFSR